MDATHPLKRTCKAVSRQKTKTRFLYFAENTSTFTALLYWSEGLPVVVLPVHAGTLFVNMFGCLALFCVDASHGVDFGLAMLWFLLFTPCSFVCWYRPLYGAFRWAGRLRSLLPQWTGAGTCLVRVKQKARIAPTCMHARVRGGQLTSPCSYVLAYFPFSPCLTVVTQNSVYYLGKMPCKDTDKDFIQTGAFIFNGVLISDGFELFTPVLCPHYRSDSSFRFFVFFFVYICQFGVHVLQTIGITGWGTWWVFCTFTHSVPQRVFIELLSHCHCFVLPAAGY